MKFHANKDGWCVYYAIRRQGGRFFVFYVPYDGSKPEGYDTFMRQRFYTKSDAILYIKKFFAACGAPEIRDET